VLIRVALPVPALDLLTYRVPEDAAPPSIGARVIVPLGSRTVTGVVVEVGVADPDVEPAQVKAVRQVLDAAAFVPPEIVALARWTAEYYAAGAGETILAALPPAARGRRVDAHKTAGVASITAEGLARLDAARGESSAALESGPAPGHSGPATPRSAAPDCAAPRLTPRQRQALELLASTHQGLPAPALAKHGVSTDVLSRLARQGFVALTRVRVDRDPFTPSAPQEEEPAEPRRLTVEQIAALHRLEGFAADAAFRVALVHGVTGSGKTEIYRRLAVSVLAKGRTALLLVPEIGLTPAVTATFRESFADRVAVQHSGLSDGERHDQWQRIRRGEIDVVVGTRSAVFAPLERLGLIVVDEEHDASYKQEESPRYNGRDVAIVRGRRAGALVVLGSATPSMESYHNALAGRYERVVLERRVLDRPLASVSLVDMRQEYAREGPDVVLSCTLRDAIERRLSAGEQALVLLNRRGLATSVFCRQCAGTVDCPNCSVSLVVHGEAGVRRARCHYCNYAARVPTACPLCAAPYLEQAGFGTERVEAEVRRWCPGARVARLDRDAIRRKGALASVLSRFREGDLDVLVGTQMIAKGHDFPRVTLVGVVSADVGLGVADFRASERTFQLLTQVAGRAGRGDQPGEAIVQTLYPEHYSIQLACRQDYPAFYDRELRYRRAMRYPPVVSLVTAVVRSRTLAGAMNDAATLADQLRRVESRRLQVLGPAPAPLARLKGEYRAQFFLKSIDRRGMREALQAALASRPHLARRTTVDVDPLNMA
jgi:primosomal protein N' (replication factor Y)